MQSTSIIELSQSALENNLKFIQSQIGDSVKISSVVKGNAYGHGIEETVPLIEACGINHFSVFSADEAIRVKNALKGDQTIMIMGYIPYDGYSRALSNQGKVLITMSAFPLSGWLI